MGFFDKLLGRESAEDGGWESASQAKRRETTKAVLERAAALAGMLDARVYAEKPDSDLDLRGTIKGLPFRVEMSESGSVNECELKYAKMNFTYIDLEYDKDLPDHDSGAPPEWEPGERKIFLAPKIYVDGSSADKEAAAFRKLPASLQERVLAGLRRSNILYFRSRYDELEVTLTSDATDKADPARWLADILVLMVDVAMARGVRPPSDAPAPAPDDDDAPDTDQAAISARKVAANVAGSTIVDRAEDECLDVRWTEHGMRVRIVLDHGFDDVDVEVAIPEVLGAFDLSYEASLDPGSLGPATDPWDLRTRQELIGPRVCVAGSPVAVARQAALVRAIGPSLVVELVAAIAEHELASVELADGVLRATVSDLDVVGDGMAAIRVARLFARVAAALPR